MARIVSQEKVTQFVDDLLSPVMHRKRAESIGLAVVGALHAERLSSAAIGSALATARGTIPKHGIKQVDRLLGNEKFEVADVFEVSVPWLVGRRRRIVVSLDWTEYGAAGQSRIAVNLVTKHGRATPLLWKTVETAQLADRRNDYEDEILSRLADLVPASTQVTVLADRGFGDEKLYQFLDQLGFDFVIRFRGVIQVELPGGEVERAEDLVPLNGRIREIPNALVTDKKTLLGAVVTVKQRRMKEPWILATSLMGQKKRAVKLYGRRFTCEENFRDEKDARFGLGSKQTRVSTCERRDRLLVIHALATVLLTLLGAAGEQLGLDRHLKSNTAVRRIHSLFRQGRLYARGVTRNLEAALRCLLWKLVSRQPDTTTTLAWI